MVVKAKEPFLDWTRSLPDPLEDLEVFDFLSEQELFGWHRDERAFPRNWTLAMFRKGSTWSSTRSSLAWLRATSSRKRSAESQLAVGHRDGLSAGPSASIVFWHTTASKSPTTLRSAIL